MTKVLMVGVDKSIKGGMWTVVNNYLENKKFINKYNVKYIPSAYAGNTFTRAIKDIIALIKIFFYTLFNNYDILHVHMAERGSVFRKGIIIKISKIRKAKVIIHMHGAELEKWYKSVSLKKQNEIKRIINSGDKIIILGNYWKDFMSSILNDKNKISVLYNAVPVPDKNMYNKNARNLLFLGVVCRRKGIYDLLEAIKIIKNKGEKNIHLLIYGPDQTEGIEELIKKNSLEGYVSYNGFLQKTEQKNVLRKTFINILPSYNEGLPMTILETMAYGIPNITTNVAAIPEVVNNKNGYIISPGDPSKIAECITDAYSSKEKIVEKSKNAYTTLKNKFSIETHIKQLEEIYDIINQSNKEE